VKLSESGGLSGSSANATPNRTSRSGSGSESHLGSEPPPSRQQRGGSTISMGDGPRSASVTPASHHASLDGSMNSPLANTMEQRSPECSPTFSTSPPGRRDSNWLDDQRMEQPGMQRHLPSLSDVFDGQGLPGSALATSEASVFSFPRNHICNSPDPPPGLTGGDNRPPALRTEQSSTGSSSSASSFGYPRTPEGPLPIHALLDTKPSHPFETGQQQSYFHTNSFAVDHNQPFVHQTNGVGPPMTNGTPFGYPELQKYTDMDHEGYHRGPISSHKSANAHPSSMYGTQAATPTAGSSQGRRQDANLDGMSALLQAGEIVNRRTQ
jgi:hypothetical protein